MAAETVPPRRRRALLVAAILACAPGPVAAGVPDPYTSEMDSVLVGTSSGAEETPAFVVVVRDVNGAPDTGTTVTLRFLESAARPLSEQPPGVGIDCATQTVSMLSAEGGRAVFHVRSAGFDQWTGVEVRMQGVRLGFVPARSTDVDGDGATGLSDLQRFRLNFFEDPSAPETDWDLDGETGLGDLNLLRAEFFRGASGTPCGA